MPLLGDDFLEEEIVQSLYILRDSDHPLLTEEHMPSFLLKPETFLVKETKDQVCQMPDASTAHH